MPYGKPRTEAERKVRHKKKYGTLKNLPKQRQGRNKK